MTDKQITRLTDKVLLLNVKLLSALQELARAASERLGYDVVADLCNGAEIEFRRIMDDGIADSNSCIRLEEIMSCIYNKKPSERHCEYCSAVCDERPPKLYEVITRSILNKL